MRRSEMVRAIAMYLAGKVPYEMYPHEIVELIEAKGMLPPTVCYLNCGEYVKVVDTDIMSDNDIAFEWEPENGKE